MSINSHCRRYQRFTSRREFLKKAGAGFGLLALADLLRADVVDPMAARSPLYAPKAKSIIWLFMEGGPSGVDLFDPKPELTKRDGQKIKIDGRPFEIVGVAKSLGTVFGVSRDKFVSIPLTTFMNIYGNRRSIQLLITSQSEAVYQEVGLSRNESADLVEVVLKEIADALARGENVKISSFGSFFVRAKGQRIGRNPKTGEEVPINPRKVLVFRASHVLKDKVNAGTGGAS